MGNQERRSFPRIADTDFAMELKVGEYDTIIHTMNVSASGVYCKIDREIPIMSRVKIVLMMPGMKKSEGVSGLEVSGVVVREHPVIIDGETRHYDLAIFFDDISQKDRDTISNYIEKNSKCAA